MVSLRPLPSRLRRPGVQFALVTVVALLALARESAGVQTFADLWLTRDQQGTRAFLDRDYARALERFEDPAWQGVAAYRDGKAAAVTIGGLGEVGIALAYSVLLFQQTPSAGALLGGGLALAAGVLANAPARGGGADEESG